MATGLSIEPLDRRHLNEIASLCSRSLSDPPETSELEGALFAPEQPATVIGDPSLGVVAVAVCDDGAHIRLLVVDADARGRGHGHALLDAAESWASAGGHESLITGADAPYFLWPGVPRTETALLCLLERRHYSRVETNFDMDVDLAGVPADPGNWELAGPADLDELATWTGAHWPNWKAEVARACAKGNLVISREEAEGDIVAVCAFEVNRRNRLGPVAVRPDLMGQGRGRPVLLGALNELRRRGRERIAVTWVGPVVPYAAVGGTVGEVFFVHRKNLQLALP